jgi:NAD(P)-dependent dehydrogenase (short-subunit alcohol dehydrogenase family)
MAPARIDDEEGQAVLLEGKVAIVTGSGGGIGRGTAERFGREGARVVVCDVNAANGRDAVATIEREGAQAIFVECDVSREEQVERLFERTLEAFGTVDVLVNNANGSRGGPTLRGPFLRMKAGDWNAYMAANLGAIFYTTQRAAQIMCARRKGSIINITTNATQRVHRRSIAYNAMKGAIDVFSMALAVDLAPWNVRVNVVRPGLIGTTGWADIPAEVRARRASQVPLGRYGFPADLAWAILFFAADDASYLTGQGIQVDGGLLTQGRSPAGELVLPVVTPENIDELYPPEAVAR